MNHRILICGGNGAGKSTLGYTLSERTGLPFFDIEDYYFPDKTNEYIYGTAKRKEEVVELLKRDLSLQSEFIFAAVKPDYDSIITQMFTCAVYIGVPKTIRVERVKKRSYEKFGERIMPGGDLYKQEREFFRMVQKRSDKSIKEWLEKIKIPIIEIDGTKPVSENMEYIIGKMF